MLISRLTRRSFLALCAGAATGCASDRDAQGRPLIRYMAWGNPEQLDLERRICREFERRHPHLAVHLFMTPMSAYTDKLQLMLASHTAPDVMRVDHYFFPALVWKNYFLCLDPFIAREPRGFLDDFVPTALEEGRYQGKLYGMNVLFGSMMVYYNKKLFSEAGLPYPYELYRKGQWTWDRFVHDAVALTRHDSKAVLPSQYGSNMVGWPMYAPVIWCFGGHFMNRDRTRMTMAEDSYAVQGLQAYADLRWKHHCTPTPADNALSPFTFESGKIAMNWGWAGESPRYRANITDFDWDIAPTPFGPRESVTVVKGNQLVIYSETRHPQESWEFVKFMTGRYAELLLDGKMRRCVPTRYSVQRDPGYLQATEPPYHTDVFLDCVRMGRTLPIDSRYMEWSQEYIAATDPLFNLGNCTALQTAQEAERRVNRVLSSEGGF